MIYAGFWKRAGALFIDMLICLIPGLILGWVIPIAGPLVFQALYKPIFEASPLQATPGKAFMGLVVTTEAGARLSLKQAFIRFLSSFLSGLICCIGYLMNLFAARKQTLHDMIAETVVIERQTADVNFFEVWMAELKKVFSSGSDAVSGIIAHQATTSSTASVTEAIEQLHKLLQAGAITQQEFDQKKAELLNKI